MMINCLITSQTRIRILKKFFINSFTKAHLRGLESEFRESTNAIRIELNRLEKAGLLISKRTRNRKYYQANQNHPLYVDIHNIMIKETGIDKLVDKVIQKTGNLDSVYLAGDLARGKETNLVELILVGGDIDRDYLNRKVLQARGIIGRELHYRIIEKHNSDEVNDLLNSEEVLLLWENNKPE